MQTDKPPFHKAQTMTMPHVATLVAPESLTDAVVAAATAELARGEAHVAAPDWLAANKACDLAFDHPEPAQMRQSLRQVLAGEEVDLAVQPTRGRRKRLLLSDMESTVIRNEMLDELAELAGVREQIEPITARAMNGELDFHAAMRKRMALLAGLPAATLDAAMERVEVNAGARRLVQTMRHHRATTVLISGGLGYFVERLRRQVGFDRRQSNEAIIENGRLTGRVVEPILDAGAKLTALEGLCDELGITPADAVAVGDGANDLAMIRAAGLGVAYHGKPHVAQAAAYAVDHGDLSTLLYFQGYRDAEIVSG